MPTGDAVQSLVASASSVIFTLPSGVSASAELFAGRTAVGRVDAAYGGYKASRRSAAGYVFFLGGRAVSRRKPTEALSATEAEYMAATQGAKEAIWERRILCIGNRLNRTGEEKRGHDPHSGAD